MRSPRGGALLSWQTLALLCLCLALSTSAASAAALRDTEPEVEAALRLLHPDESPLSSSWLSKYLAHQPPLQKRRPISVNQDLMSISRMMGGGYGDSSGSARAQNFLSSIGKRQDSDQEAFAPGFQDSATDADMDLQKRRPISVNQDLMSISRMMGGGGGRGRADHAQNFLSSIGKRASAPDTESVDAFHYPEYLRERRSGRLSMGVPLEALSGLIQAQRRRQFVDRAQTAHSRLMHIGKRSVPHKQLEDLTAQGALLS